MDGHEGWTNMTVDPMTKPDQASTYIFCFSNPHLKHNQIELSARDQAVWGPMGGTFYVTGKAGPSITLSKRCAH
eukprot:1160415-Pelagomonas_calceolata.AAC.7